MASQSSFQRWTWRQFYRKRNVPDKRIIFPLLFFLTWWSKTTSFVGRKLKYLFYHGFYQHKILKMDIYIKYWLGQTNGKISCKLWPKYFPIINLGQDQHAEVRFVGTNISFGSSFILGRVLSVQIFSLGPFGPSSNIYINKHSHIIINISFSQYK